MSRPHIIVIDEELPWPLNSGKRIRSFNLIRHLAQQFRITWLAHRNQIADEIEPAILKLHDAGIQAKCVNYVVPAKMGLYFYGQLLKNLGSKLPYSVSSHTSAELKRELLQLIKNDPPALVHCEWTPYANNCSALPIPFVVDAHNVETLIWQRMADVEKNLLKRAFIALQAKRYARFERWAYQHAARTIAVSEPDAIIIRDLFHCPPPTVIDNGVDTDFFQLQHSRASSKQLLFMGGLDWRPNLDALTYFLDEVFPLLLQKDHGIRFQIVGRHPPDWLIEKAKHLKNVELAADVPDVRPFLHRANMLVVPLRIGGGSRLKILEALAAGVPVVSSDIGAEGLRLDASHCKIVPTSNGKIEAHLFAEAIMDCINNPHATNEMTARGSELVRAEYDWKALSEKLGAVWNSRAIVLTVNEYSNRDRIQFVKKWIRKETTPDFEESIVISERDFAVEIVSRLRDSGYEAYWAGGCVRDQLLGLEPDDYDVATSAAPETVVQLFNHTVEVGISFGVVEVIGPRLALGGHYIVQVATFRSDGEYLDGRRPQSVRYSDAREDALRRDFTFNGMFYDPLTDQVLDYVNGQADLQDRVLRAIGNPVDRFTEDKLRLLRAIRFAHRFDCKIESDTFAAIRQMSVQLSIVSMERIAEEMRKILRHPSRARAIAQMADLGLLQVIVQELSDVSSFDFILKTLAELGHGDESQVQSVAFELALSALLHSLSNDNAAQAVVKICKRWKLANAEIDSVRWLVANQDALRSALQLPKSTLYPLLSHPDIVSLLELTRAMAVARGETDDAVKFCRSILDTTSPEVLDPTPLVTGDHLVDWGYKPGKLFKEILDTIRRLQLDDKLHSFEAAKSYIVQHYPI